ncbi:MAG: GNAT family N-acetyltransferase [Oscillospiraceae bacterium]|nr:GNAT family N-acetyltransferase [Oscillospiraceae bacterium]
MVRIADINDLEQLTELFTELHRHHVEIKPETFIMPEREWFSWRLSEILGDSGQTVLVHDSGGINAYAVVRIINVNAEEKRPRRVCYIDCFAVSESCRRRGIGTTLFGAVKAFGSENGCTSVQLGVTASNTGAVRFYEKMGLAPRTIQMEERI